MENHSKYIPTFANSDVKSSCGHPTYTSSAVFDSYHPLAFKQMVIFIFTTFSALRDVVKYKAECKLLTRKKSTLPLVDQFKSVCVLKHGEALQFNSFKVSKKRSNVLRKILKIMEVFATNSSKALVLSTVKTMNNSYVNNKKQLLVLEYPSCAVRNRGDVSKSR